MKIAVTYENGQVFQYFGHTEEFKIYEIEDGKLISTEIIGSNGSGHSALAALLDARKIDVLICGGIGGSAQAALAERGMSRLRVLPQKRSGELCPEGRYAKRV